MAVDYKFNENLLVEEVMDYINSTYDAHYGANGLQSSEVIVDRGRGLDFFLGNIDKYNGRYGSKGDSPADYRKDLMKIVHYGILSLYEHDRRYDLPEVEESLWHKTGLYKGRGLNDATPEEWDRAHKRAISSGDPKNGNAIIKEQ